MYEKIVKLLDDGIALSITMSSGQSFIATGYEKMVTEKIKSPVVAMHIADGESILFVNTDFIESFRLMTDNR